MCYCPAEQTGGKVLKDRRLLTAPEVAADGAAARMHFRPSSRGAHPVVIRPDAGTLARAHRPLGRRKGGPAVGAAAERRPQRWSQAGHALPVRCVTRVRALVARRSPCSCASSLLQFHDVASQALVLLDEQRAARAQRGVAGTLRCGYAAHAGLATAQLLDLGAEVCAFL